MQQIPLSEKYADSQQYQLKFNIFIWTRRFQILLSSLCLLYIILDIIRRKIYVYTSLKLFMWACIFYSIGMFTVLCHTQYANGSKNVIQQQQIQMNTFQKTLCGLEAFVNLFSYCIAYCFALLVTLNIYQILNDKYRGFMKNILKNKKTIIFLLIMFIIYFLPYMFIYLENKPYSYCPTGFQFYQKNYLLYCGLNHNQFGGNFILAFISVYLLPTLLFLIHGILLFVVRQKSKIFQDYQYLNSKQKFIIYSGYLSMIVFIVQAINLVKTLSTELLQDAKYQVVNITLMVIFYIFDLYPFALLYYYKKYLGQSKNQPFYKSTLITTDQLKQ